MPAHRASCHEACRDYFALSRYHEVMGLDWKRYEVVLGPGGRVRCEPDWRLTREWSERLYDHDLWLVWAGRGRMEVDGRPVDLRAGVCLWMRPGSLYLADHEVDQPLGVSFQHFELVDRRTGRSPGRSALPGAIGAMVDYAYGDAVLRRVRELERGEPAGEVARQLLRGLLMDFERGPTRQMSGTDRRHHDVVRAAAMKMDSSPAQSWDIGQLARQAGYSADHFTRIFREHLGQTPQAYATAARLARARQLLAESPMNISQIAEALGYRDVYYFSRQFTQHEGQSPRVYRRSL